MPWVFQHSLPYRPCPSCRVDFTDWWLYQLTLPGIWSLLISLTMGTHVIKDDELLVSRKFIHLHPYRHFTLSSRQKEQIELSGDPLKICEAKRKVETVCRSFHPHPFTPQPVVTHHPCTPISPMAEDASSSGGISTSTLGFTVHQIIYPDTERYRQARIYRQTHTYATENKTKHRHANRNMQANLSEIILTELKISFSIWCVKMHENYLNF